MRYKLCKFCENRARDTPLRGVYIPHFGQIWVKISMGVLHPCRCTDGDEIWHGGGDLPCQISPPSVQRVAPSGRKASKSASESKLNTGRFALRAMLPVKTLKIVIFRGNWWFCGKRSIISQSASRPRNRDIGSALQYTYDLRISR